MENINNVCPIIWGKIYTKMLSIKTCYMIRVVVQGRDIEALIGCIEVFLKLPIGIEVFLSLRYFWMWHYIKEDTLADLISTRREGEDSGGSKTDSDKLAGYNSVGYVSNRFPNILYPRRSMGSPPLKGATADNSAELEARRTLRETDHNPFTGEEEIVVEEEPVKSEQGLTLGVSCLEKDND